MGHGSSVLDATSATGHRWACTTRRRAACQAGRGRTRPRVRGAVRALSPTSLPLLQLDAPERRRCPGRAAVHARGRPGGAETRSAKRAHPPVAVPDRTQRVDHVTEASPGDSGSDGAGNIGPRPGGRRTGRRARPPRHAALRSPRPSGSPARRAADARAERPLARRDRGGSRDVRRSGKAGDLRCAIGALRARGRASDAL